MALQTAILALSLVVGTLAEDIKQQAANVTFKNSMSNINFAVVSYPGGTVIGAASTIESFNGIPYADPPVGDLRFRPPRKLSKPLGAFDGTGTAAACPQMPAYADPATLEVLRAGSPLVVDNQAIIPPADSGQEDCLTITIHRSLNTKTGDNLPVLFWIYGDGFAFGSTRQVNATHLLHFAERRGQKIIFVAVNYRVNGFGFMGGSEILKEGSANAGLLDQRMGLEWVADNIRSFGGDPDKVTLAGESAGAISAFNQMVLFNGSAADYNGKPLFRSAYLSSGSITPTDPVDSPKAQSVFNTVTRKAGCVPNTSDTLPCLRRKSFKALWEAINSVPRQLSYNSLALSYLPRPDGHVLPASPDVLVQEGKIHAVPMILGNQEDEGTIFATAQKDITSTDMLIKYLEDSYFTHATPETIRKFVDTYPLTSTAGSPFRTGYFWDTIYGVLKPGYKRLAALLGDVTFTLTRRLAIEKVLESKPETPIWSYFNSYYYGQWQLGTHHGSGLDKLFKMEDFGSNSTRTYLLNFVYNLDPNVGGGGVGGRIFPKWPQWAEDRQLLWTNATRIGFLRDDFRNASYNFFKDNIKKLYY